MRGGTSRLELLDSVLLVTLGTLTGITLPCTRRANRRRTGWAGMQAATSCRSLSLPPRGGTSRGHAARVVQGLDPPLRRRDEPRQPQAGSDRDDPARARGERDPSL